MNRVLTIEYEEFEDLETKVMSIVDSEKDEVLNMFHGDEAEELYNKLITLLSNPINQRFNRYFGGNYVKHICFY